MDTVMSTIAKAEGLQNLIGTTMSTVDATIAKAEGLQNLNEEHKRHHGHQDHIKNKTYCKSVINTI